MGRKKVKEEDVAEIVVKKKSRLLSKFEMMEGESHESAKVPQAVQDDTAQIMSQVVGTEYLQRKMTEEIVLWKKVYSGHVTKAKRYSSYTQKIEGLFSGLNPDAKIHIEFSNPQSIHDYESMEERILSSFKTDLFAFLVAGAFETYIEVESVKDGTDVYISRLVDERLMEGRDELVQTLSQIKGSPKRGYDIYERYSESEDGREVILIGVKISETTKRKERSIKRIRSPRANITV